MVLKRDPSVGLPTSVVVDACKYVCHIMKTENIEEVSGFSYRQSRFLIWASDVELRVDQGTAAGDAEEVLRRLETELQSEVALKSREVDWLLQTGSELAQAYAGDGEMEVEQRKEIESKVQQVHDAWDRLQNLRKSRANKLHDILQVNC
jgi:nesprin-1